MIRFGIPKAALDQHIGVLGKTKSGKSSVMRTAFVEPMLEKGWPLCIIDPKGDWYGLKLAADGQSAGYPVVIFGGEHSRHVDVLINEHAGAHIAELVATGNRPCIIDLKGWTVGARTRFYNRFAETLFRLNKSQRHLIIDEVHNFAPQGGITAGKGGQERAQMIHWSNRLASEGLGLGINLIVASQRPQKVHKDLITSLDTLIAMRVLHNLDREAIERWIKGCGDSRKGKEVLNTLAQLQKGEAWVWSPEIGHDPRRKQFKMFTTYDSFAPPRRTKGKQLKGWADVDLDEIRENMASIVTEAEANDPKLLKRRIIELEAQLAGNRTVDDMDDAIESLRVALASESENLQIANEQRDHYKAQVEGLQEALSNAKSAAKNIATMAEHLASGATIEPLAPPAALEPAKHKLPAVPIITLTPETARPRTKSNGQDSGITGPMQRILDSIAWWNAIGVASPTNVQVATKARYSAKGSAYTTPRSRLSGKGLIEYTGGGGVELTDEGRALASNPGSPTGTELRALVMGSLKSGPMQRILEPLLESYPNALSNKDLATAANYSPEGSAFTTPRSRLSGLGLIEYPTQGMVKAADFLFPELSR